MKKARPPQQISPETWKSVEAAICIGALGYSEVGRRFNISPHAIIMRAKRHGWAVPSKIAERTQALQARYKACEQDRNGNEEVIQAVAETWTEKGEMHRQMAFSLANGALKNAAKAPPNVDPGATSTSLTALADAAADSMIVRRPATSASACS